MENPTIDANQMTRSIRDRHTVQLELMSPQERLEFFRQQAERMNNKASALTGAPVKAEQPE